MKTLLVSLIAGVCALLPLGAHAQALTLPDDGATDRIAFYDNDGWTMLEALALIQYFASDAPVFDEHEKEVIRRFSHPETPTDITMLDGSVQSVLVGEEAAYVFGLYGDEYLYRAKRSVTPQYFVSFVIMHLASSERFENGAAILGNHLNKIWEEDDSPEKSGFNGLLVDYDSMLVQYYIQDRESPFHQTVNRDGRALVLKSIRMLEGHTGEKVKPLYVNQFKPRN